MMVQDDDGGDGDDDDDDDDDGDHDDDGDDDDDDDADGGEKTLDDDGMILMLTKVMFNVRTSTRKYIIVLVLHSIVISTRTYASARASSSTCIRCGMSRQPWQLWIQSWCGVRKSP